ncbi:hypothetical protein [Flavobacterium silvaticum]|uniref:Uncharacterized protein n=1 Tax=Flavobacterium silvaticum TaxID=1852020 RepID=A0A972JG20_9FLAO|nr:hypothetical protein [Flavobacterium silvaticum]NMH27746.1 hypothetical protein [Flavobacterium silvaticum]
MRNSTQIPPSSGSPGGGGGVGGGGGSNTAGEFLAMPMLTQRRATTAIPIAKNVFGTNFIGRKSI